MAEVAVPAVKGEVVPDPDSSTVHVFRLGPRGYVHCTADQARVLVAASEHADRVVYGSARVVVGLFGTRYVVFDLRTEAARWFHDAPIGAGEEH
jgi:hypothetical protein